MKIQSNAMDRIRQFNTRTLRETVGLQEVMRPDDPKRNMPLGGGSGGGGIPFKSVFDPRNPSKTPGSFKAKADAANAASKTKPETLGSAPSGRNYGVLRKPTQAQKDTAFAKMDADKARKAAASGGGSGKPPTGSSPSGGGNMPREPNIPNSDKKALGTAAIATGGAGAIAIGASQLSKDDKPTAASAPATPAPQPVAAKPATPAPQPVAAKPATPAPQPVAAKPAPDNISPEDDISPEAKAAGERRGVNAEKLRAFVAAANKNKVPTGPTESVQSRARSASFVFERIRNITEGRPSQRHPLEGHDYHKKSNDELVYIAKDAHKAAEAMKGHNTKAENKYRDQANDSATVRYYRQKSGMPDWYKKKYGHMKEDVMEGTLRKDTGDTGDASRYRIGKPVIPGTDYLQSVKGVPLPDNDPRWKLPVPSNQPETKVLKPEPVDTWQPTKPPPGYKMNSYGDGYIHAKTGIPMKEAKEKTEYDYEGDMARGQLQSIISNAQRVHDMLEDNDNLAEWVQSKITLAEDYISTVANYMMSEVDEEVQQGVAEEVEVGDKVSFNHPMTAAPGKTMKKVGTVHKVEDDTVHVKVKSKYGVMTHKKSASELTKEEFNIDEEVESIDELNKDTLYSYSKKAEVDQDKQFTTIGKGMRDNEPKSANKAGHKFSMRSVGINRADKRLQKEEQIEELSSNLLGRYKKSAGAQASAADKSGDYAKGNKRFSGIMKATKKQFANDTKQGVAEGATGAKPGFMLRQDPDLAKKLKDQLARKKKLPQGADFAAQRRKERLASNGRMDEAIESHQEEWIDEAGPGLWANIHAKRQRIKQGSKERMRNPGEKGAPESGAFEKAGGTNEEVKGEYDRKVDKYLKKKYAPDDNKAPPFDAPYAKMPKADKSGAIHSPMSRAKHLAKMAGRKQAGIKENSHDGQDNINTPAKRSLSKTAGMVKTILKGAKSKNKNLDKFENEPELSSQIVKQE